MKKKGWIRALALLEQVGFSMAVPIFLCVFLGIFIDNTTNKSPLFLIIFIFLGVGAAFRNLFYIIGKEAKRGEKERDE
ncbi:AtpZ/AtpI family protein [Niameybacter massiliensis]|uniref:AtpZ/AtpI family protein n=1 Tax=Holtiella tumoricola TaxID=3018743 RepID=A0AA42DQH5_9FIRM|nr:AtpZ/AtpI family protein [Holtiella tumoricola]MDA3733372.1 AtpZ/AtpI family protein [Holtiella tumoricola]